ncbi:MAG: COX15/CtaA family protein [Chloroflexota bacterium]|nr:COX15/CtaA family protein [Chloroflexota bacterium]MDE2960744.1 COX15/CtaA family protein [Chloroflexota bacterium]
MASISISTSSDAERRRGPTWLQGLATATVISVFVLVIIGGVVRVTGSGLGCPDWPLCYGKALPPLEYTAIIEYTHRFVASVIVGPLILATAGVALARYRSDRWVWLPAAISIPLLIVQGLLGGITVLTHLPGGIVALHLATAEALLATCVFVMVASYRTPVLATATLSSSDGYHRWAIVGAVSVYVVIVSGALVTAMGATGACVTWPLCQGQAFPMNHLTAVHMFHRYVVLVLGVLLLYATWRCWTGPTTRGATLKWLAALTVATFVVQVIVGAATIWLDFQAHWRALHLTAATAVWTAAAAMAIVAYIDVRTAGAVPQPHRPAGNDGQ